MKRPSWRGLAGWAIALWVASAVILFMAKVDPPSLRSEDWFVGPAVVGAIHQAWTHRTSDLPRIAAWAIGGLLVLMAVLVAADALAALIRPWARTQPWLDTALIASVVVMAAAVAITHVSRESTARGRWISLAELAVAPAILAGLWMVSTLGPLVGPGILLAVGSPIAGYWIGRLRTADPAVADAPARRAGAGSLVSGAAQENSAE